ncbi:hypothetical protein CMO88_04730 [Candidatus Woesearchaeota archaeon]|nr:hypothetical protein [Candidatus Woesearchaeota archaeon]|tara:strand:- start:11958 stop:12593 length:636 start_codon:yes stop_codon:yes gene_type:complete
MALFGLGKKVEEAQTVTTPVDEVLKMRDQGFTNNQIVQALQRNGYKTHQIFDAMNQADLKNAGPVEGAVEPGLAQPIPVAPKEDVPPNLEEQQTESIVPQENYDDRIEEVSESIIEEKWEDLMKEINKLLEWKETMENKMAGLEQGLNDLKSSSDNLQKAVLGKVTEYDKTMRTVSSDMKAMDTVFQKVLPTLTDNVSELSRLAKKGKTKR